MSKSSKILLFIMILGILISLGIIAISLSGESSGSSDTQMQTQEAPF